MAKISYEDYVREVRKHFTVGAKNPKAVDEYFKKKDTVEVLKDSYKYYSTEDLAGTNPSAVANCLELLY